MTAVQMGGDRSQASEALTWGWEGSPELPVVGPRPSSPGRGPEKAACDLTERGQLVPQASRPQEAPRTRRRFPEGRGKQTRSRTPGGAQETRAEPSQVPRAASEGAAGLGGPQARDGAVQG